MPFEREDLLVMIGPSGSGKSSVVRELVEQGFADINPSWTTREPRPGEEGVGIEHRFVGANEFEKKANSGFFLDTVQMFELPYKYGLAKIALPPPGKISLVMLRSTVLPLFARHYGGYKVYQIEDDLEKVKLRLLERLAQGEPMGSRLMEFEREVGRGHESADRVFRNAGSISELVKAVTEAIETDFKKALRRSGR